MPRSIAALSQLGSLTGRGNQFFDPTGEGAARDAELAELSDRVEATTGLNPTAMQSRGLMNLEGERDELATRKRLGELDVQKAESAFLGPEGHARTSPAMASLANLMETKRQNVGLEQELQPMEEGMKDVSSERAAARRFLPEAGAARRSDFAELLEKIRAQYVEPQEERTNLALEQQELKNRGALDVANTKVKTAQDRAAELVGQLLRRGRVDESTGATRPYTPEESSDLSRQYGVDLPTPTGTVMMRAPNGDVGPVSPDQVEHYKGLGAVVVR